MYEIIKRKFTALKYPYNSPERKKFNKNSITSEYAPHKKYLVLKDKKPALSVETYDQAIDVIKHPDKYKPKYTIKKYTPKEYATGNYWYNFRKNKYKVK